MLLDDQYKAPPAILAGNGRTTRAATIVCERTVQPSAVDEPVRVPSPSVAGFKEWLERQPQWQTFEYTDPCVCAAAQYLRSIGAYRAGWTGKDLTRQLDDIALQADATAWEQGRSPTFGDVLAEIEKAEL